MTATLLGNLKSGLRTDELGHRVYNITWLAESNDVDDGPGVIAAVAGLPAVGSGWTFGNDNDPWAFCLPSLSIQEVVKDRGEWTGQWILEQVFSTKPQSRCQTSRIEDPLMEPPRVSGTFNRYSKEATHDRNGNLLLTSSMELIRGLMVDDSTATVRIGINSLSLPLAASTSLRNHVNASPMWGLDSRSIKLSEYTWERHMWGTCSFFYTNNYDFDVNFDRYIIPVVDRGTRTLKDGGNPQDQRDYIPYRHPVTQDAGVVFLDGAGGMLEDLSSPVVNDKELEKEADLFVLGIPASF